VQVVEGGSTRGLKLLQVLQQKGISGQRILQGNLGARRQISVGNYR
jgi:hypothetical protein